MNPSFLRASTTDDHGLEERWKTPLAMSSTCCWISFCSVSDTRHGRWWIGEASPLSNAMLNCGLSKVAWRVINCCVVFTKEFSEMTFLYVRQRINNCIPKLVWKRWQGQHFQIRDSGILFKKRCNVFNDWTWANASHLGRRMVRLVIFVSRIDVRIPSPDGSKTVG